MVVPGARSVQEASVGFGLLLCGPRLRLSLQHIHFLINTAAVLWRPPGFILLIMKNDCAGFLFVYLFLAHIDDQTCRGGAHTAPRVL